MISLVMCIVMKNLLLLFSPIAQFFSASSVLALPQSHTAKLMKPLNTSQSSYGGKPNKPLATPLPAFPGAEGAGTTTTHGRRGIIYQVTNLNDSGQGSLRAGIELKEPRIIVFNVGGAIELETPLVIKNPYVMIAGQTALGDGIMLRNQPLIISAHDVVVRYLTIRSDGYPSKSEEMDGLAIQSPHPSNPYLGSEIYNIAIDHCSIGWSSDENLSVIGNVRDVTIQRSIISEGVYRVPRNGRGLLLGPASNNITIHHNLFAHNSHRNILSRGSSLFHFVNNVIYNWGFAATQLYSGWTKWLKEPTHANIIGNYYKRGVDLASSEIIYLTEERSPDAEPEEPGPLPLGSKTYVFDNLGPRRKSNDSDHWQITSDNADWSIPAPLHYQSSEPISFPQSLTTIHSAEEVLIDVLKDVGANSPKLDSVDRRVLNETMKGRGTLISKNADEVGGYPVYTSGNPKPDSDNDSIPDGWEDRLGFNKYDSSDALLDADGDGYTNIEEYLNKIPLLR